MSKKRPKIIYHGDRDRCRQLEDYSRHQMDLLREDMSFQGLEVGGRKRKTEQGELIECRSAHGEDILHITAPEPAVEEGVAGLLQFELYCSNGKPVTINMLSYLVLYDVGMAPVYVYDVTSEDSATISVGGEEGNIFTISTNQIMGAAPTGPFWAFYACHEDTEKWGGGHIVRNGIRTQWPFRYRTEWQFRNEDMVVPGNLYRDVIPYGCFKFDITGKNDEEETVTVTSGLDFEIFKGSGDNVNSSAGVDFVLSQHEDNELQIYNKKIVYPDQWPRYICEQDGNGFWVFILFRASGSDDEADKDGDDIKTVNRPSKCECESDREEDEGDEEEEEGGSGNEGLYSHISEIMADGALQYKGKCKASEQGKEEDLILPLMDLREDLLCAGQEAGTGKEMDEKGGRSNCANWLCLGLMREYDMANVTPDLLTHLAITPVLGPFGGEYVPKEEYEKITNEEAGSSFKSVDANSKGMAYGYGYDMNLEQNCWTVVLPGVSLDWNGLSTDLWLLKPMDEEEAEEYKNKEDSEGEEEEDDRSMIWLPFSQRVSISYNEATQNYEAYLGAHPAHAYRMSYSCKRGIFTMYNGVCCFEGNEEGDEAFISDQGGNYFFDRIPSNTLQFAIECCDETIGGGAESVPTGVKEEDLPRGEFIQSSVYDETGKWLEGKRLHYNEDTGFWEITVGGKRACPSGACAGYGLHIVARSRKCRSTLFLGSCDWDDVTEGHLLKPDEYDVELCKGCPTCSSLIEIDGYSLDKYKDHVLLDSGESVELTFEGCFEGPCPEFIESLDDGLSESKKGTFTDGGGDGETYKVTYNASGNLCNKYDAGTCPKICDKHVLPCCCGCDEENTPSLSKEDCNPDSGLAKYRVEPGCPGFSIMRRNQDKDGNWKEWKAVSSLSGCDFDNEEAVSNCWFCQGCDREKITDGCPEDKEFEIKVVDSMDRESNVVSSKVDMNNELYEPPEPHPDNPETVELESSVGVSIINGEPPFTWDFLGGEDVTMGESTSRHNTFYAGSEACGSASARVTDDCDNSTVVSVRILNGEWKLTTRKDCPVKGPGSPLVKGTWKIYEAKGGCFGGTGIAGSRENCYNSFSSMMENCEDACSSSSDRCLTSLENACFDEHRGESCKDGKNCVGSNGYYVEGICIDSRNVSEWTCPESA